MQNAERGIGFDKRNKKLQQGSTVRYEVEGRKRWWGTIDPSTGLGSAVGGSLSEQTVCVVQPFRQDYQQTVRGEHLVRIKYRSK
jgi:hypothetical protein